MNKNVPCCAEAKELNMWHCNMFLALPGVSPVPTGASSSVVFAVAAASIPHQGDICIELFYFSWFCNSDHRAPLVFEGNSYATHFAVYRLKTKTSFHLIC
jgi:hypothetical protein